MVVAILLVLLAAFLLPVLWDLWKYYTTPEQVFIVGIKPRTQPRIWGSVPSIAPSNLPDESG